MQCVSMFYTEKICIALICSVFADPVTYVGVELDPKKVAKTKP